MANIVSYSQSAKRVKREFSDLVGSGPAGEFLFTAMRRIKAINASESELREDMMDDIEFRFNIDNSQWDQEDLRNRRADGRPTLTINRIPQFIRQVTNQMRSSRMAVQVNPIDSSADIHTAEAIQGIIRSIENNSDADIAYATAGEHQCTVGRGYWRVLTEYSDDDNYEQNIVIATVVNPFSIHMDASHQKLDGSDARYAFVCEYLPDWEFEEEYGTEYRTMYDEFMRRGNRPPDYGPIKTYMVCEYMYKEVTEDTIVEVIYTDPATGQPTPVSVSESDLPKPLPTEWKTRNKRKVKRSQCKWAKITPCAILDGNDGKTGARDFPSKYIPIVQVLGDIFHIDGKRDLRGMVRDARMPQQMYNYWASALTEMIGMSPRAPYIGYEGSFKGHEKKWEMANRKNYAYLEVAPVTIGGQPAPIPQRTQFSSDVSSLVNAFQLADNDLKAVMGLYDASLGQQGPEQSGKAILARQRQGEIGNSNYLDNMARSIRFTGRIILDMMPRVLTPNRMLRILGVDNESKQIMVHTGGKAKPDAEAISAAQGIEAIFDISVGRYDVTITTGPNFASRRQEAVNALLELLDKAKDPTMVRAVADILVRNMDWPGAQEIAARLHKMVPPEMLDPKGQSIPPQVKEKMKKMEQELEELRAKTKTKMAEIQAKHQSTMTKIQSEAQLNQAKLAMKQEQEQVKNQAKLQLEQMQQQFDAMMLQTNQRFDEDQARLQQEHEVRIAELEHDYRDKVVNFEQASEVEQAQIMAEATVEAAQVAADATTEKAEISAEATKTAAKTAAAASTAVARTSAEATKTAARLKPKPASAAATTKPRARTPKE